MALQLPIVNGSSGVWGTMLNTALTDLDGRTTSSATKDEIHDAEITDLKNRIKALEQTPPTRGMLYVCTSSTRPPVTIGQIILETDTGYLSYDASISGAATRVPWPGSYLGKCRQTSAQTIATGTTGTALTWQICDTNRLNGWTGGSRFTAPVRGLYEFAGGVTFAAYSASPGYRATQWMIDGSTYNTARINAAPVETAQSTSVPARTIVVGLNPGQYVELYAAQNTTASIATDVSSQTYQPYMQVKYMGYYGS